MRLALVHVDLNRNADGSWCVTAMYEARDEGAGNVVSAAVTNLFPDNGTAAKAVGDVPLEISIAISG